MKFSNQFISGQGRPLLLLLFLSYRICPKGMTVVDVVVQVVVDVVVQAVIDVVVLVIAVERRRTVVVVVVP